jgi:hypothetical protein
VKDLLDRIGLSAIFGSLLPGAIVVASFGLWVSPKQIRSFVVLFEGHEVVLVGAVGLVSYVIGLIVAYWSAAGAGRFVAEYEARGIHPWFRRLLLPVLGVVHGLPVLRHETSSSDAQLEMWDVFNQHRMEPPFVPWEFLSTYRVLVAGWLDKKAAPVVDACESAHNQLLFALGVALALLLTSVQGLVWCWIVYPEAPPSQRQWIFAGAISLAVASLILRLVAGGLWRRVFQLTVGLTHSRYRPPVSTGLLG